MKISKLPFESLTRICKQTLAVALAWAVLLAPAVAAAQEKSQSQKASAASKSQPRSEAKTWAETRGGATKSERPGGPQEGIKIHGHWVIEVLNPDRSLADRREFQNHATGASVSLYFLLTRQSSIGHWAVSFENNVAAATQPCAAAGANDACRIAEAGSSGTPVVSTNLKINPGFLSGVELSGNATVTADSTIDQVSSYVGLCPPAVAPATSCSGITSNSFTQSDQGSFTPVRVTAGQIVVIKLQVTFS